MATHSSVLAWRILWTEEPGGLLSMGSHRVRHDRSNLACMHALEREMATYSSTRLENPRDGGAWWAAVYAVAQSQTRLKRLSSSSRGSTQSCPALCNPMDCSSPGSSAPGIFQARILEWIAMPPFRGSSRPRSQTQVSHLAGRFFTI